MPCDDPFTPPAPAPPSERLIPVLSKSELTTHHPSWAHKPPLTSNYKLFTLLIGPGVLCSHLTVLALIQSFNSMFPGVETPALPSPPPPVPGDHTFICLQNQSFSFCF